MKRYLSLLLACLMLVTCLVGCGSKEPTEPDQPDDSTNPVEVNYSQSGEPRTIDSIYGTSSDTWDIVRHIQEGLMRIGEDGKSVVPGIAESYEQSDDKLTYTFHLRDTAWSDGTPVTAYDFEYGWKTVMNPETGSRYAMVMNVIKNGEKYNSGECSADEVGVKALDEKTLEVVTEYYNPMFLHMTTLCQFMPVNQAYREAKGDDFCMEAEHTLCSGPWMLAEWKHQESIRLEKNPNYYNKDAIKIDVINMLMVGENTTAFNMFVAGQLDSCGCNGVALESMAKNAGYEPTISPTGVTAFIDINQNSRKELANLNFRKALMLGIDRGSYLTTTYGEQLIPANGMNVYGVTFLDTDYREYTGEFFKDGDIETAKQCLAKALEELGYKDASEVPALKLMISSGYETDGGFLQEQWRVNLGLNVEVINLENTALNELYYSGNFEMALTLFGYDYPYPVSVLTMWLPGHQLYDGMWCPDEFVDLYDTVCYSLDDQEKLAATAAMEKLLIDDAAVIPYYHTQRAMITSPRVHGEIRNDLANLYLYYAYVSE